MSRQKKELLSPRSEFRTFWKKKLLYSSSLAKIIIYFLQKKKVTSKVFFGDGEDDVNILHGSSLVPCPNVSSLPIFLLKFHSMSWPLLVSPVPSWKVTRLVPFPLFHTFVVFWSQVWRFGTLLTMKLFSSFHLGSCYQPKWKCEVYLSNLSINQTECLIWEKPSFIISMF